MTISKDPGRQYALTALVNFSWEQFTSGTIEAAVDIPGGATVVGGSLVITTAFNSATSDTFTAGDVGGTETRYGSAIDGTAAAETALSTDGVTTTVPTVIGVKWTGVGAAPTQGAGYLRVEYVIDGRAHEAQP